MESILHIINEMSPYLLLGFFLAGLMHSFVPARIYSDYLSRPSFRSVLYAALFGIPLPLCSCGVIPTSMSLRKEGASKGSVVSFLVSTPQTGVDSIIATYSLMGLPFAIIRPMVALLTAVLGGQMVNMFVRDDMISISEESSASDSGKDSCCNDDHCGCGKCHDKQSNSFLDKMKEALEYAFVDMMADIGKWLVIGLVVAGLITVLVPDSFFEVFAGNSFLSMLLVLCMAIPMYLCATGSIPIAVAMMMKGLTPGAGLVLLMAGPATNIASILVVRKVLGRRTLFIYLSSIIAGAIAFGFVIDYLMPRDWFVSSLAIDAVSCHEETSWFVWVCTIVLALLLLNALVFHGHSECHCKDVGHESHDHESCGHHGCDEHDSANEIIVIIRGMNCNHCRMNVEKAIKALEGVLSANVDLASGKAHIVGNVEIESIRRAVESIGFTLDETA